MHSSAGRREDSVAAYLRANRADRRRVVGVRVPTIRRRDPCRFDTRKPRQPDRQQSRQFLRLTPQAQHQIREFAFAPSERSSRLGAVPNRPHPFAQPPPLLQIYLPKDKSSLHRHGNSVPTDSTQSRARIPSSLPPASLRPTDCPRETPGPGHSPGPTRPPAGQIREPVSFRRERSQDSPPPSVTP